MRKALLVFLFVSLPSLAAVSPSESLCANVLNRTANRAKASDLLSLVHDDLLDATLDQAGGAKTPWLWESIIQEGRTPWMLVQSHQLPFLQTAHHQALDRYYRDLFRQSESGRGTVLGPKYLSRGEAAALLRALTRQAAGRTFVAGQARDRRRLPYAWARAGGSTLVALLALMKLTEAGVAFPEYPWSRAVSAAVTFAGAMGAIVQVAYLPTIRAAVRSSERGRRLRTEALRSGGEHPSGVPVLTEDTAATLALAVSDAAAWMEKQSGSGIPPRWIHLGFGDRPGAWLSRSSWIDVVLREKGDGFEAVALVR